MLKSVQSEQEFFSDLATSVAWGVWLCKPTIRPEFQSQHLIEVPFSAFTDSCLPKKMPISRA